jgi:hypothetical protein
VTASGQHGQRRHGPGQHGPGQHGPGQHSELPAELADLLREIVPPGGGFGHRQHIQLAYLTVRRYGTGEAAVRLGAWLRHITAYAKAPQKYNATVTRAWTELVGYHVEADGQAGDFELFASQHPELLDKRLLSRHYRSVTLASMAARTGWVQPDLTPFPWMEG